MNELPNEIRNISCIMPTRRVTIVIPPFLQPSITNRESVEVSGSSVGECLNNLTKQFAEIENILFAKNGELQPYVGIYVNGKDICAEGLSKPVKDGDKLHILYMIAGG